MRHVVQALIVAAYIAVPASSIANPSVFPIEVGATIAVPRIAAPIFLRAGDDPDSPVWSRIPCYRIALYPAPAVHQSVNLRVADAAARRDLDFRAAHDGKRLYVVLSWHDETHDAVNAYAQFADAAAVQFALGGGEGTSYMMGSADTPVNIWHWRAGRETAENLAAGGFGSTTRLPLQDVTAASAYDDTRQRWTVVFSRPLDTAAEHHAKLGGSDPVMLALALWDGAGGERDGHKLTTPGWIRLALEQ